MSIYSNSGDSYWKERQQKNDKKSPFLLASMAVLIIVASAGAFHTYHSKSNRPLSQRRTHAETTEMHWKECESRVNTREVCASICQPERNSLQRKTMHQACLRGCQEAHVASSTLSCRGKVASEEELFSEIGGLAYVHCSKFQSVDPKPEVFATCRKYHRAGTKHGFRVGMAAMKEVLEEEWQSAQDLAG